MSGECKCVFTHSHTLCIRRVGNKGDIAFSAQFWENNATRRCKENNEIRSTDGKGRWQMSGNQRHIRK